MNIKIDWKSRIRNKTFIMAIFALIMAFGKQTGCYDIPIAYNDLFNTAIGLLVTLGVVIDPSTEGISDSDNK